MRPNYDVLIIGAGLFGATCACELSRKGFSCRVIDARSHIGGNCYTKCEDDIRIHWYGPHIFHTSNKYIWDWINKFAQFNRYRHRVKATFGSKIYSFPINLSTLNQLWGVHTPGEAKKLLEKLAVSGTDESTIEGWAMGHLGRELYEVFIKGYTIKQWNRDPVELPASIIKRIPVRLTFDDDYFDDDYQGIPIGGYTPIFEKLLAGVDVSLNADYFTARREFDSSARAILYTGPIDRFFDYRFGKLEYRAIRFEHRREEVRDFQGVAQMNYTSADVPYTRIVEHKHFEFGKQPVSWITEEYPYRATAHSGNEMYPVRNEASLKILRAYRQQMVVPEFNHCYFGGRLAEYQYYDMHQVLASALKMAEKIEVDLRSGERRGDGAARLDSPVSRIV